LDDGHSLSPFNFNDCSGNTILTQAILIIEDKTSYTRAQERIIYNLFINDSPKNKIDFDRYEYLYSVADLKTHLNRSIHNFFNLKHNFLENVEYVDNNTFVKMEFSYLDNDLLKINSQRGTIKRSFFYNINNKTLGPFDKNDGEVKRFLNDVEEFKLNYKFQTLVPRYYYDNFECFLWVLQLLIKDSNSTVHFCRESTFCFKPCYKSK
jgi:hypothetical protein